MISCTFHARIRILVSLLLRLHKNFRVSLFSYQTMEQSFSKIYGYWIFPDYSWQACPWNCLCYFDNNEVTKFTKFYFLTFPSPLLTYSMKCHAVSITVALQLVSFQYCKHRGLEFSSFLFSHWFWLVLLNCFWEWRLTWSVVDLPGVMLLNKSDSPSPRSY